MNPYDPTELDRADPELDGIARRLEEHAAGTREDLPIDLVSRVWEAVEAEPVPPSRWTQLSGWGRPARALAAAAVVVAVLAGALAAGGLLNSLRPDVGGPPTPAVLPSPSAEPTVVPSPEATPSTTPSPTPSPTATPTLAPTVAPTTPQPTASDDDELETPEPSESGDDNSGPGGDGDD
ncbi:MAG TPA: hypothetical protein VF365_06195 [Candidatus Limnocylindria bacterium]